MRSTLETLSSSLLGALALGAAAWAAPGCADSLALAEVADGSDASATGSQDAPPPVELIADGGKSEIAEYRGSPLCRITETTCNPDDDGTGESDANLPCAEPPRDASAGGDVKGCRLASPGGGAPQCDVATAANGDGAKCTDGSECAPGFDCVAGEASMGVCRRYCCAGTCATNRSQNGGDTFCDVQKLYAGGAKAPVCMPLKSCKLFLQGECAETETCGVVTENGATGCVANGSAGAQESCEDEHCNGGLTCLGQPGSRKCYQLCQTQSSSSCGPTQVCKTSTIFNDPGIGVCDEP